MLARLESLKRARKRSLVKGYPSIVEMLVPLNYHHSQPQPWSEAGLSLGDKLCACDARAGEVELFWAFWSPGDPERVPDFKC